LNTTQQDNALFQIGLTNMGGAHGFESLPFSAHYPHTAYTAAPAAAAVGEGSLPGVEHRPEYRLVFCAGKAKPCFLHRNLKLPFHT
jgi:hypothetical protein